MADAPSNEIITEQKGIFRTNCLDWCVVLRHFIYLLILTGRMQSGPDELCTRHPLPHISRAVPRTDTPRVDPLELTVVHPWRALG